MQLVRLWCSSRISSPHPSTSHPLIGTVSLSFWTRQRMVLKLIGIMKYAFLSSPLFGVDSLRVHRELPLLHPRCLVVWCSLLFENHQCEQITQTIHLRRTAADSCRMNSSPSPPFPRFYAKWSAFPSSWTPNWMMNITTVIARES